MGKKISILTIRKRYTQYYISVYNYVVHNTNIGLFFKFRYIVYNSSWQRGENNLNVEIKNSLDGISVFN